MSTGFIDGDLIESYLDLNRTKMQEVVQGLQVVAMSCVLFVLMLSHIYTCTGVENRYIYILTKVKQIWFA